MMTLEPVDEVVKGYLSKRGLSIHFYTEALSYAIDCIKELNYDTLKNVVYEEITVREDGVFYLPVEYVDWVELYTPDGKSHLNNQMGETLIDVFIRQ